MVICATFERGGPQLLLRSEGPMLGTRLRQLREARGLRQFDLAVASGVSPSNISKIENDQTTPSIDTLSAIARALHVRVADLTGEQGEEGETTSELIRRLAYQLAPDTPPSLSIPFLEGFFTLDREAQQQLASLVDLLAERATQAAPVPTPPKIEEFEEGAVEVIEEDHPSLPLQKEA
jgi:transcriptional regulator with XRE-family HTH domain